MLCRPEGLTTCRKCNREAPNGAVYCPFCGLPLNPKRHTPKPRTRPNGTGTAFKRGKTWYAQVTIGTKPVIRDGKPASQTIRATKGGFSTKRDALEYCQTLREEAQAKRKQEKEKLTMQQIYDLWLPTHQNRVGKSTMDCYRAAWKYFKPIHQEPFADLDLDDLQECVDECDKGKRTKENMKALAGLLMKYALPRHQTDMNYAEYINTGNDAKGTRPAFTKEQVESIRQQIGKTPHAEDVYCLIYTGFRPTEMFALTKGDYKDGILYGGIKTEAGKNRAVPISPKIATYIETKLESDSNLIFPKDDGTEMSARYFRDTYFYPVLAAAGIQPIPTPKKPAVYVPYSARHTFANLLKDAPGSDKDKAGLIGHEDYKTTKRLYQSAELDALKAIIQSL